MKEKLEKRSVRENVILLIICIFWGPIGVHRFILKDTKTGWIYLFSFGLFSFGWIKDCKIIYNDGIKNNPNSYKNLNSKIDNLIKHNLLLIDEINELKKQNVTDSRNQFIINNNRNLKISLYSRTKIDYFVDDYIVFDLETTGYNPKYDKIIEIGALKYKNNMLIDRFHVLVNPGVELPKSIINLTGITNEDLQDKDNINIVLPSFIKFIGNYTLIAHNGSFDLGFIEKNLINCNMEMINNNNIDTLRMSRKYISETENHKLETLKKYFNLDYESHRSLDDCYTTNYVYQYCKNKSNEKNYNKMVKN